MSRKLASNPDLKRAMIPDDFNVACRRPTPGNGYLEALTGKKTTVFTDECGRITPSGVVDSGTGEICEVDVIICATGFDTSYRPRFPIIGLNKDSSLAEQWKDHPSSYLGVAVDGFPNYFTYSGPYTPVAQGSVLPIISLLTRHFIEIIKKMRQQHVRRLSPKASAVKDFVTHADTFLPRTCWADPCPSWFKQGKKDGKIIMWPGSRLSFFEMLRKPNFEDYDIEYWSGNRFGYMGNGFVDYEFDESSDITWYLDDLSEKKEWKNGVPFNIHPDEFASVSSGGRSQVGLES